MKRKILIIIVTVFILVIFSINVFSNNEITNSENNIAENKTLQEQEEDIKEKITETNNKLEYVTRRTYSSTSKNTRIK